MGPPTGGKDDIMLGFFNIYFAIHSIAGNKSHGYCFLGLDFNVHKERQPKLTRICLAKLKNILTI